jgi:hypothetical protein
MEKKKEQDAAATDGSARLKQARRFRRGMRGDCRL